MKKALNLFVLAFVFTIPLNSAVSVKLLIISLTISIFISFRDGQVSFTKTFFGRAWDILLYFSILLIGILYSENWKIALSVVETSFSLVAISIILQSQKSFAEDEFKEIFYAFTLGLIIACLICIGNSLLNYADTGNYQSFFYYELTEVIGLHPTYFAYYLIASITYWVHSLYYNSGGKYRSYIVLTIWIFFITLILTGARTAYVSLLLIFSFFILKFILEQSNKAKRFTFILVCIMLVSLFALNSLDYGESMKFEGDYWERLVLWKSAIDANPSPILGVGTGDYKTALNEYYFSHGLAEFAKDSYNSHNQFVQIYFSNGIIGVFVLMLLIGHPLFLSVKSQYSLGILLFFPFLIYGVTEVFLGRYQGVVFFSLLHQIIVRQYYTPKSANPFKDF